MAHATDGNGVVLQDAAAHVVAGSIQALDGPVVVIDDVERLGIHGKAAQAHEHATSGNLGSVERRLRDGEHALGRLAKVGVDAGLAQLVVTLDVRHKVGLGSLVKPQLVGQLLDGVCDGVAALLHHLTRGNSVLADGHAIAVKRGVILDDVVNRAVGAVHLADLIGIVVVENLNAVLTGLAIELRGELLAGNILVYEALTTGVCQEECIAAEGAAQRVGHGGVGAVLHLGADPHTHLLALANVGGVAGGVHVHPHSGIRAAAAVVLHHVGVAAVITGAHDDALGSRDFEVGAVHRLGNDAISAAGRTVGNTVTSQLASPAAEAELGTGGKGSLVVLLEDAALVGHEGAGGLRIRGRELLGGVELLGHGEVRTLDGNVVGVVARRRIVDKIDRLGRGREEPVERRARILGPLVPKALVRTVAHLLHHGIDSGARVEIHTVFLLDLAVVHTELARTVLIGLGLLDDDDLGASLGSSASSAQAGNTAANDNDVSIDSLGNLIVGDRLGSGQPARVGRSGTHVIGRIRRKAALARLLRRAVATILGGSGGLICESRTGDASHGGDACETSGTRDKIATRNCAHTSPLFCFASNPHRALAPLPHYLRLVQHHGPSPGDNQIEFAYHFISNALYFLIDSFRKSSQWACGNGVLQECRRPAQCHRSARSDMGAV